MEREYNFMCWKSPLVVDSCLFYLEGGVAAAVSVAEMLKNYPATSQYLGSNVTVLLLLFSIEHYR